MMPTGRFASSAGRALLVAVALAALGQPALAGPVVLETVVGYNAGCDPAVAGECLNFEDPLDFQQFGPDTTSYPLGAGSGYISLSGTIPGTFGSPDAMLASAEADAGFGVLKVRASAEYNLTSPDTRIVFAGTQFIEQLTINAAGLTGTPGTLSVTYDIDGVASSSGSALAAAISALSWGGDAPFHQEEGTGFFHTGSGSTTVDSIDFVFGTPLYLSFYFAAAVGTFEACPTCEEAPVTFVALSGPGSGSSDFFGTLILSGLVPKDASGAVVRDPTFSSASGTTYTTRGVAAVPEPGSLLLLSSGITLGVQRWRCRAQAPRSFRI
jgi:hypothetical protein